MLILGYIGAVLIGFTLGLIGGGGSILTVPILVYLLHIDPLLATAYSLFVVGAASLIGAIQYMRKGLVNYKTAVVFAIPSFITVFLTRRYLMPSIPEELATIGDFILTKNVAIMAFFALIMLLAAVSMIRTKKKGNEVEEQEPEFNFPLIIVEGIVVGLVTGIVGAGGGFLIVPALVLLAKLPMKMAVGTSLLIISVKSLIGFLGDLGADQPIDWSFLLIFTGLAALGIFAGTYVGKLIPGEKLKKGFGWFVLAMGTYILLKELVFDF